MASKPKSGAKKRALSPDIQKAGDHILTRRGLTPAAWRAEQLKLAKLAIMDGEDTAWSEAVLRDAYAALLAEDALARQGSSPHTNQTGGES